jgi:hypothetical protein
MAATTYAGNGTSQSVNNGNNNTIGTTFQPDFAWLKDRTSVASHLLFDSVRGATKYLISNDSAAETTNATTLTAFNSNGFSVGSFGGANGSGDNFVGWQWKSSGSTVSNTNGSITSTVSANTTAGFSIVTYTGNGSTGTVGHGLGVAPSLVIAKTRSVVYDWYVYHGSIPATQTLFLDLTLAATTATAWNNTAPTRSVFSVGSSNGTNQNGTTMVAYCWAAVPGYSAFGSYTGNGSSDGPFIYTGFRPRYILIKRTDSTGDWVVQDTSRSPYNVADNALFPNLSNAESVSVGYITDFLSNGFKIRNTALNENVNGATYVYIAFAENPFQSSRAR